MLGGGISGGLMVGFNVAINAPANKTAGKNYQATNNNSQDLVRFAKSFDKKTGTYQLASELKNDPTVGQIGQLVRQMESDLRTDEAGVINMMNAHKAPVEQTPTPEQVTAPEQTVVEQTVAPKQTAAEIFAQNAVQNAEPVQEQSPARKKPIILLAPKASAVENTVVDESNAIADAILQNDTQYQNNLKTIERNDIQKVEEQKAAQLKQNNAEVERLSGETLTNVEVRSAELSEEKAKEIIRVGNYAKALNRTVVFDESAPQNGYFDKKTGKIVN